MWCSTGFLRKKKMVKPQGERRRLTKSGNSQNSRSKVRPHHFFGRGKIGHFDDDSLRVGGIFKRKGHE